MNSIGNSSATRSSDVIIVEQKPENEQSIQSDEPNQLSINRIQRNVADLHLNVDQTLSLIDNNVKKNDFQKDSSLFPTVIDDYNNDTSSLAIINKTYFVPNDNAIGASLSSLSAKSLFQTNLTETTNDSEDQSSKSNIVTEDINVKQPKNVYCNGKKKFNNHKNESKIPILINNINDKMLPQTLYKKVRSTDCLNLVQQPIRFKSMSNKHESDPKNKTNHIINDIHEEKKIDSNIKLKAQQQKQLNDDDKFCCEKLCLECRSYVQSYINQGILVLNHSEPKRWIHYVPFVKNFIDYLGTFPDVPYVRSLCVNVGLTVLIFEIGKCLTRMLMSSMISNDIVMIVNEDN